MINVALTHDVDRVRKTYQYVTHSLSYLSQLKFSHLFKSMVNSRDCYWNMDEIVEIENKYKVKSTFFFLNESIRFELFKLKSWKLSLGRYSVFEPKILKYIQFLDQNGWEIGVHGSYNSFNSLELLKREKADLESIVNHEVIGIRQHYLNLSENTWELQRIAGFRYDASFGYLGRIGFKDSKYTAFKPFNDEFVVFPLSVMDEFYMLTPSKWNTFLDLLDFADQRNALVVINWHSNIFNETEYPGYKNSYIKIIEECLKRGGNFKTLSEYYSITK